jgi:dihydrofolate synthase/folylpolyglutamate synthase
VREVQHRLDLLRPDFRVITVGGTNGKGSTAAMLEAILHAAGYRVGAYTSPHLLRFNERVRLQTQEADDDALCAAFARVESARSEVPLTYFEFGTLAALDLFRAQRVEAAVLEVGLGGRLDAVNAFDADAAIVTSIGTDHQDWLGPDRESIGREKAGIFRAGRPAICGDPQPPASIAHTAQALGARLYQVGRDFGFERQPSGWRFWTQTAMRGALPYPALRGDYQLYNAACALMALETLGAIMPVTQNDIRAGLLNAVIPGRFQTLPGVPVRVLDVAHNIEAAQALAATLAAQPVTGRTLAVVGMLKDKPMAAVLRVLANVAHAWYVGGLDQETARGARADELCVALQEAGIAAPVEAFADVASAYAAAQAAATPVDRVVAFGSFYTVGAILRLLSPVSKP